MYSIKRWLYEFKSIVTDFVTGIGLFWLLVEISSYSTKGAIDVHLKSIWLFCVVFAVILFVSLLKNKPKSSFSYKLRGKDSFIELKIGDAFKNKGSLIVPINDYFDVSLGGNVKKAKSIQNKLTTEFYSGKEEHLYTDIKSKIDVTNAPFEIGTTVEIEQNNKIFYLLVNSKKNNNNRVESSIDDFLLCLSQLWPFIALESGRNSAITIPLISTSHGRKTNINRETAIKEIIESFIDASKSYNVADKLIISLHPNDIHKGDIKLDELDDFLKFSCQHYKETIFSDKPEGQEVSASSVKSIHR